MSAVNIHAHELAHPLAFSLSQDNGLIWGHTEASDPVFKFASGSQFLDFVGTVALDDGSDFAFLEVKFLKKLPVANKLFPFDVD